MSVGDVSSQQATRIIEAVTTKAREIEARSNVAVVDSGANLVAFLRMDGAMLGSADVAMRKARTAALFEMESGALGVLAQPGGALYGIEQTNGGLVLFGGGSPIKDGSGVVIGAVGVSGGTVEEDTMLGEAGAATSER